MQFYMLLLLMLVIFVCAFGYMLYHYEVERRAQEKKRNQNYDKISRSMTLVAPLSMSGKCLSRMPLLGKARLTAL
jgi:hypothetical protein